MFISTPANAGGIPLTSAAQSESMNPLKSSCEQNERASASIPHYLFTATQRSAVVNLDARLTSSLTTSAINLELSQAQVLLTLLYAHITLPTPALIDSANGHR